MGKEKEQIKYPHLNDCGGSLSKQWYVEMIFTHPVSGRKIQKRIYSGFNKLPTYYERKELADKLIREWTNKINSGWRPWEEIKPFYDALAYKNSQMFTPGLSTEKSYIKPLIADYLDYKAPQVKKSSLDDYRSKLRQFSFYLDSIDCAGRTIEFYDNEFMSNFLKTLHDKEMSRMTINKYRQVLHDLFRYIRIKKKINIVDPFSEDIPRFGKIVDMSPASIPEFIREKFRIACEVDNPQLWLAINFVYYTAIRPRTELRKLKIKQINFSAQCVTVTNDLAKTSRTETIDIPDQLFHLIKNVWKLHRMDGELYIFSHNGQPGVKPLGKNTMGYRFAKIRDSLGLPKDIQMYSFKHSGAQELLINNANIYEIKDHLRHSSLQTTEHYLRKRFGNRNDNLKRNFPGI